MRSRPGEDDPDPAIDKYAIMNHPYALDSPGEFFIDYTANRLYVMTKAQANPAGHDIEISRLSGTNPMSGFEILRKSRSNLVINIYFDGPYFVSLRNTVNGAEIIGNTCYDPQYWCINVNDASATNVVIKNNILGLTWASPSVVGNSDNSNNYFIDYLPPNAGPDSKVGPADFFVDPENSDFHISGADAPVVDAGADVSAYTSIDKDGNTRPYGSGWDIGAYELGSSRFTTTVD